MNIKSQKLFCLVIVFLTFLSGFKSATLYDNNNSNVVNLNPKNFETQITLNRSKNIVSVVHFYKLDDGKSRGFKLELEKLAADYDLMFKVGAVNCKEFNDICEKHEVKEFPTLKVYPPLPTPVFTYENKIETSAMVNFMGKFLDNKSKELNNNNIDAFLTGNTNLPKTILFTDKKGTPLIYKALSVAFNKKIEFGIVRSEDSGITSKYKVNKFPKIMVISVDKKTKFYDGENKYKPLFDFLNIYSETFFRVGEDKTKANETTKADKPWLNEKLPELTKESGNEVCFKVDGIVCVILINNEKPSDELINQFSNIQNWLSPKIDRGGVKYKFGWINSTTQKDFITNVELAEKSGPTMILVNPSKRKRFFVLEEELTEENMSKLIF